MQIVTVQFNKGNSKTYLVLKKVFKKSVELCMPEAEFVELSIPVPDYDEWPNKGGFVSNTYKLKKWAEYISTVDDDVILADCDMLMLQSAEHAFDEPFDIAVTKTVAPVRVPVNGGIIMVRNTERAKAFIKRWNEINEQMYANHAFHNEWKHRYPGMNQAALGYMLEVEQALADVHYYTTRQWNATNSDWGKIYEDTVFVHIKGALRREVMTGSVHGPHAPEVLLWREVQRQVPEIELKLPSSVRKPVGGGRRATGKKKAYDALVAKHKAMNAFNWAIKLPDGVIK